MPVPALQQRVHVSTRLLSLIIGLHGLFVLANTLLAQLGSRHVSAPGGLALGVPLIFGTSLIYLSTLLRRRKRNAWWISLALYVGYLLFTTVGYVTDADSRSLLHEPLRTMLLPLVIVAALLACRKYYVVRSDMAGFRNAVRFSLLILAITMVYGTAGFVLLDEGDFHRDISLPAAAHYTVDRFGWTTDRSLEAHSRRARIFLDSLSFVSMSALVYVAFSLFQPLRFRLNFQATNRQKARKLLEQYPASSEDFFKLWPPDKHYFFDASGRSVLAYQVQRGVALCLGGPSGDRRRFAALLADFEELCLVNDWSPAFVHVAEQQTRFFKRHGYQLQRLGQEAVVDLEQFCGSTVNQKYFRNLRNRLLKQQNRFEILEPPHHPEVIGRLQQISDEWLKRGGHVERGFAMGYFSAAYSNQCRLAVMRDAAGTIQAFLNLVPADFDKSEATYDLLRQADAAPGNSNDFLLIGSLQALADEGYRSLNLGLCPLSGLSQDEADNSLINAALRFAYINGDRFYSFNGLYRFKAKYKPTWCYRYVAYKGGIRGFSRSMTALMRVMRVKRLPF